MARSSDASVCALMKYWHWSGLLLKLSCLIESALYDAD